MSLLFLIYPDLLHWGREVKEKDPGQVSQARKKMLMVFFFFFDVCLSPLASLLMTSTLSDGLTRERAMHLGRIPEQEARTPISPTHCCGTWHE